MTTRVLEELDREQAEAPRGGNACRTSSALAALEPEERTEFVAALEGRRYSDPVAARVLTRLSGVEVSQHSVGNHRRGGCRCGN